MPWQACFIQNSGNFRTMAGKRAVQ